MTLFYLIVLHPNRRFSRSRAFNTPTFGRRRAALARQVPSSLHWGMVLPALSTVSWPLLKSQIPADGPRSVGKSNSCTVGDRTFLRIEGQGPEMESPDVPEAQQFERFRHYLRLLAHLQLGARPTARIDPSDIVQQTLHGGL